MDCHGCFHRYSVVQSFFPVTAKQFKPCLKENPTAVAQEISSKIRAKPVKCTQREYKRGAQEIYDELNPVFERTYNVPLEKAFTTLNQFKMETKTSKADKKRRNYLRKAKENLEEHWKKTSVMRYSTLY